MFRLHLLLITEQYDRADRVMQFAQVSRPAIMQQALHGEGMYRRDLLAGRTGLRVEFSRDEPGEILAALAQGRNEQNQPGQTMIKVLPKPTLANSFEQRSVGC